MDVVKIFLLLISSKELFDENNTFIKHFIYFYYYNFNLKATFKVSRNMHFYVLYISFRHTKGWMDELADRQTDGQTEG